MTSHRLNFSHQPVLVPRISRDTGPSTTERISRATWKINIEGHYSTMSEDEMRSFVESVTSSVALFESENVFSDRNVHYEISFFVMSDGTCKFNFSLD